MKKQLIRHLRGIVVGVAGIVLMIMFSACSGIASTNGGQLRITGTITSVDTANHSVTVTVNGQTYTINGLSDQQVTALKTQQNKTYTIQVTQNSDGSYTINQGSNPAESANATPGVENETPGANETPSASEPSGANEPGNISFIGKVQSFSGSSIVVSLPDGQSISMNIVNGQTDLSSFNGAQPRVGQTIKVKANANTDGSFLAAELKPTDSSDLQDQNTVDFQGVTTSPVSSDNHITFKVGNKSFSYTIVSGTTNLSDFNNNAQSIGSNQAVKVKVQFQGSTGTVLKVENASK